MGLVHCTVRWCIISNYVEHFIYQVAVTRYKIGYLDWETAIKLGCPEIIENVFYLEKNSSYVCLNVKSWKKHYVWDVTIKFGGKYLMDVTYPSVHI